MQGQAAMVVDREIEEQSSPIAIGVIIYRAFPHVHNIPLPLSPTDLSVNAHHFSVSTMGPQPKRKERMAAKQRVCHDWFGTGVFIYPVVAVGIQVQYSGRSRRDQTRAYGYSKTGALSV